MPISKEDLDKYLRGKVEEPKDKLSETLLRVIRRKCLECSNGIRAEVDECPIQTCPLWKYRKGVE